jgi:hypothetical protein
VISRKYLYEATARGERATGHVAADSVADARQRLVASGHSDVVIHDDDFMADLRTAGEKELGIARPAEIEMLVKRNPTALGFMAYAARRNWLDIAIAVVLLGIFSFVGVPWWVWAFALVSMAVTIYAIALPGWLQWQQNEMHKAFWAGDWTRSESIAARLRRLRAVKKLDSVKLELDGRIAACWIMKGRVEEGYRLLDPWVSHPNYWIKLGGLHYYARDWKGALAIQERIFGAGERDSSRIDLAQMLARHSDDDARAAELLDALDSSAAVPAQIAFIGLARGVLALKSDANEEALGHLSVAVNQFQEMAANPLTWGSVAIGCGYLAVALSRTGDPKRARLFLEPLRPVVERHAEDRLIGWLRAEGLLS